MFEINIFVFFFATLISQGIKFFVLVLMAIKIGPKAKKLVLINWKPAAIITTACIVIALAVINLRKKSIAHWETDLACQSPA